MFKDNLMMLRKTRGMTQEELAGESPSRMWRRAG